MYKNVRVNSFVRKEFAIEYAKVSHKSKTFIIIIKEMATALLSQTIDPEIPRA